MGRGPDVAKLAVWRRRLREFDRGTATVMEFCRRAGIAKATFYQWRRRLSPQAPAAASAPTPSRGSVSALSFLPVELTGRSESAARIEVLLPNGTRVLVPGCDREALRTVIEAAAGVPPETRPC